MTAMQTIKINEQDISIKEYRGQRVVTFKEIDRVHGRPEGTARKRFNDNRKHFEENVDYFYAKHGDNQMSGKRTINIPPHGITLITQSGYLMLVKSFGDKLAWNIQRELVNSYFEKRRPEPEQMKLELPKTGKTWRGQPVMTIRDLSEAMGVSPGVLAWRPRYRQLVQGEDYFLLEKDDLGRFKIENRLFSYATRAVIVLTASGARKLMGTLGHEIVPKVYEAEIANHKQYSDVPDNPAIQAKLAEIKRELTALSEALDNFNMYHEVERQTAYCDILPDFGHKIAHDVYQLSKTPFGTTNKRI